MARPSTNERARRLLALLPYLGEQGTIPLAELARVTGSDEATTAADLTLISLCGVDDWDLVGVLVDGDSAEVFSNLPALERPVRLTGAEARALLCALEAIGVDAGSELSTRLAEVAGHEHDVEELGRTVRSSLAPGGQAAVIAALGFAAGTNRVVEIRYYSAGSEAESVRAVHPLALYTWRGTWYLLAWCETAGEERTFRVDRITAVEQTGRAFERPAGVRDSPGPVPDMGSLPRATVVFSTGAPDLSEREWPGAVFEPGENGTVVASVPYAGTAWIARKVAARLGEAYVTAPEEVRRAVAARSRSLIAGLNGRQDTDPGSGD
jgi:proteasome accessory factor C